MAVTFDKFSIRDYTSKMRSIDVFKCWPFAADELSREDVESWLPPMTVPKFRWWSDELAAMRSNRATVSGGEPEVHRPENTEEEEEEEEAVSRSDEETESAKPDKLAANAICGEEEEEKLEMVCPVCRDFNAATLTAVNAHIDGCLAQTMREERRQMRRSKSKAPKKKRSIAEIFQLEEEEPQQQQRQQHPQVETVLKFWPVGEDDADEVSVTVTKFRWLSRRLEALRSNGGVSRSENESAKLDEGKSNSVEEEEKLEMVCPVCRVFNAATVTAVNAHIDGCLAQAMREERWQMRRLSSNPKPKAPKKRSIVEILTVTPQIDADTVEAVVDIEEEDEDEGNGEEQEEEKPDYGGAAIKRKKSTKKNMKRKRMKKVMKKKGKVGKHGVVPLNNESKKMKKRRKKKKKNLLFNNELAAKKEDAYKHKVQNPSSTKLRGTNGNKTVALDDIDASSAHEKKLGLKILSAKKMEKVQNCDSIGKQQKAVSPIHGILKNHKHFSRSTSGGRNIQDGAEESNCDVQVPASDRHVRFSDKDYILGPKKGNPLDESVFNLSSDVLASSLGKEQSSGSDEVTENLEANRNDDSIATSIDKRKEVSPIVESKQFSNAPGQVAIENFLKPYTNQEKSKHLVGKTESLSKVAFCDNNNLHRFDRSNTATPHFSPCADISRPLSASQAGQISGINTHVGKSGAFSYTGKFIECLEDPTFQLATVNSNANTRTFLEPSLSYSASHNKRNESAKFPLHTYGDNDNNGQALGGRPSSDMFSGDMIDNSFHFPGWGKGSVRSNCMDQNYFGLPLNSHGELINFSSSGKGGMSQPETSFTLRDSLSGFPANYILHQSGQEYLNSSEKHVVQKTLQDRVNPFPHYPARLGVTELHGRERADIYQLNSERCSNHYVQQVPELNLMRNPFLEQNQRDKVPNCKGNGMISPKESSDIISPSFSQPTMRLMGKDVPIGRSSKEKQQCERDVWADMESRRRHNSDDAAKQDWVSGSQLQISTETALQSGRIQSNQALQSNFLMEGPESEFLNRQSNHELQYGGLGVSRNASSNLHHITQAPTSCAVCNRAPDDLPKQFISGAKPQGLSFQSQVLPAPCNFNQPTSLSNGELTDRKKHHHVMNSALGFPFLHPVVEEQAKTPWFQRSYRSLPPWLLGSTHERLPGTSSSKSFPQNTWGNNFTTPSVNHSTKVLYAPNSVTYHCPKKTSLSPASIAQPPHVPVTKPPSAINIGCRNIVKVTDRVKLDDKATKDHHPCTNSRKRPAANLVDLTKPNKSPNIEVQENLSRVTGLARENSSSELQRDTRAVDLDTRVDSARGKCEAQNLNPKSYLGFDSFNLDGVVMSGPVKLSPGARHILKPSQNMDQDNSRLIHSTIPIAATTDCGRDLELQRKLTKMYRF